MAGGQLRYIQNKNLGFSKEQVRDFHFRSLHEAITPLYFFMQPAWFSQFSLRLETENMDHTLALIEAQRKAFEPDYPFAYSFFDESFNNLHRAEQRTAAIIQWFTLVWRRCGKSEGMCIRV